MDGAYEVCLRAVETTARELCTQLFRLHQRRPPGLQSRDELRRRAERGLRRRVALSVSELCKTLYIELMESLADLGFKACIAYSGHFPGDVLLQEDRKGTWAASSAE